MKEMNSVGKFEKAVKLAEQQEKVKYISLCVAALGWICNWLCPVDWMLEKVLNNGSVSYCVNLMESFALTERFSTTISCGYKLGMRLLTHTKAHKRAQ